MSRWLKEYGAHAAAGGTLVVSILHLILALSRARRERREERLEDILLPFFHRVNRVIKRAEMATRTYPSRTVDRNRWAHELLHGDAYDRQRVPDVDLQRTWEGRIWPALPDRFKARFAKRVLADVHAQMHDTEERDEAGHSMGLFDEDSLHESLAVYIETLEQISSAIRGLLFP